MGYMSRWRDYKYTYLDWQAWVLLWIYVSKLQLKQRGKAYRQVIDRAVVGLDAFGGRQGDAGIVTNALQDVGQEQVLGVEGNVQQEPGCSRTHQHPEVPAQRAQNMPDYEDRQGVL